MKKKITRDLIGDFLVSCGLTEILLFAIYYFIPAEFPHMEISNYITQYYWVAALGAFLLFALYFGLWTLICFKRVDVVCKNSGLSDGELWSYYKDADKCCNYRVEGNVVFINTSHGIICMTKDDVYEHKARRVHHTKRTRYKRNGYTSRVSHDNDYYTYHFKLVTRYGTFKNTVANYDVMQEVNDLFR